MDLDLSRGSLVPPAGPSSVPAHWAALGSPCGAGWWWSDWLVWELLIPRCADEWKERRRRMHVRLASVRPAGLQCLGGRGEGVHREGRGWGDGGGELTPSWASDMHCLPGFKLTPSTECFIIGSVFTQDRILCYIIHTCFINGLYTQDKKKEEIGRNKTKEVRP